MSGLPLRSLSLPITMSVNFTEKPGALSHSLMAADDGLIRPSGQHWSCQAENPFVEEAGPYHVIVAIDAITITASAKIVLIH